ncbi:MAG: hypothetical protein HDT33_04025 [Clostridiales bacterium]|nr:hypothetical protein [Clostridiales bacterium]
MKQLEISRLMDEYTDTEFFPEGGSVADTQEVKDMVLANVKAPAGKKRMPARKKVLLAATLAAVMVVLVGAGYLERTYHLASGTIGFSESAKGRIISIKMDSAPLELEDGQLFLVMDGERTDITDLIDENVPYISDLSNPSEDMTSYLILGGTPEHYGWLQWFTVPDPYTDNPNYVSIADDNGIVYGYEFTFITVRDGTPYQVGGVGTSNPDWRMFSDFNTEIDIADFQWLQTAADQLGIPFIDTRGEIETIISAP